jgi:hypothetical protein
MKVMKAFSKKGEDDNSELCYPLYSVLLLSSVSLVEELVGECGVATSSLRCSSPDLPS